MLGSVIYCKPDKLIFKNNGYGIVTNVKNI